MDTHPTPPPREEIDIDIDSAINNAPEQLQQQLPTSEFFLMESPDGWKISLGSQYFLVHVLKKMALDSYKEVKGTNIKKEMPGV
jgi:hypothetical protein